MPTEEVQTVGQAPGNFILWPRRLVSFLVASEDVGNDIVPKRSDLGRPEMSAPVKGIDKGAPGHGDVFKVLAIQVVTMEDDAALVTLEHDASPDELYIPKKELMEMALNKEMASSAHISFWCTYLHRMLVDQGNLALYGFIDPMFIQGDVLVASEDPVTTIRDILARDDHQFYLAPYLNNRHWQLLLLYPRMNVVVFFCSLGNKPANELKTIIETSINASHMLRGERRTRAIRWIIPSSRIQRGSWECGYYVMQWMLEIISSGITERWSEIFNNPSPLSDSDINIIKKRWATFFLEVYHP